MLSRRTVVESDASRLARVWVVPPPSTRATGRVAPEPRDPSGIDRQTTLPAGDDTSLGDCAWCGGPIPAFSSSGRRRRRDSKTCSKGCRQSSSRFRVGTAVGSALDAPMSFAYADPPYPGKAHLYPEGREVDHGELIGRLVTSWPDGWALSTSSESLQMVLALCPPDVRIGAWLRPVRRTRSRRPLQAWEPVIIRGGRPLPVAGPQGVEDAVVARGRHHSFPGALVGMKPPGFSEWLFHQLGALAGDELADLYPGSGAVSEAWRRYAVVPAGEPSLPPAPATRR